jgi:transcriptional regulator with XRE-family HTH domain
VFQNLGPALRLLRELRRLSQAEVARRAGIGKSQISKYEGNRDLPKLDSLERVLQVLDYRPDTLFSVVALLDRLPEALAVEPGAPLKPIAVVPFIRSFSPLDTAFETAHRDLITLQRLVLELIFTGPSPPSPRPRGPVDPST